MKADPKRYDYRSAITGRFVTRDFARRYPSSTMKERRGGRSMQGAYRSCRSGRFVSRDYAHSHPRSTLRHR